MIAVKNLAVAYRAGRRSVAAVRGVSFSVARGEAYGIVGESGSGKTTVLRALAGLVPQWRGAIALDGRPRESGRRQAMPGTVQMVFQDSLGALHPRHTVDRLLSEPLRINGVTGVGGCVERALSDVGLPPGFRFRYPHELSSGQRQRVAIARALVLEPKIVLLDEPTSALDVSIQAEILNLLARLRSRLSLTFVLVSHDLAVIAHMCEQVGVMQGGRMIEELSGADLRAGRGADPYTRALVAASRGYGAGVPA